MDLKEGTGRSAGPTTALAFVTYSLVPYLGILFCPGAVMMGVVACVASYRSPQRNGWRASLARLATGVLILGTQVFLWWLLYKVPQWSGAGQSAGATALGF
ncbi:MAG: hypothetical protein QOD75_946 [Blastocatellia bacterium]|nr:hypothetical protein [Blastocatellia bacterium]